VCQLATHMSSSWESVNQIFPRFKSMSTLPYCSSRQPRFRIPIFLIYDPVQHLRKALPNVRPFSISVGYFDISGLFWYKWVISIQVGVFKWQLPRQRGTNNSTSHPTTQHRSHPERPTQTLIHDRPMRDIHRMPQKNGQSSTMVEDRSVKKFPVICWFSLLWRSESLRSAEMYWHTCIGFGLTRLFPRRITRWIHERSGNSTVFLRYFRSLPSNDWNE
jgi:hypothetical protein